MFCCCFACYVVFYDANAFGWMDWDGNDACMYGKSESERASDLISDILFCFFHGLVSGTEELQGGLGPRWRFLQAGIRSYQTSLRLRFARCFVPYQAT